ncbi:hypothetical protein FHS59_003916 [Algoriphagus iocasae]|uniref:Uncharacterized protein n=1 Tax=Algoriphagus iocasae TaxID=1836499 RepID=A0A841MMY4_9BACT|nr:hypothetical protein [Algoriphagus iocasae]MBB6328273.1 hypothetical protein [Algoriphagus iocasae]
MFEGTEDRRQETEVGSFESQKDKVRKLKGQKTEDRRRKYAVAVAVAVGFAVGSFESLKGKQGSWKWEVGSRKWKVASRSGQLAYRR